MATTAPIRKTASGRTIGIAPRSKAAPFRRPAWNIHTASSMQNTKSAVSIPTTGFRLGSVQRRIAAAIPAAPPPTTRYAIQAPPATKAGQL